MQMLRAGSLHKTVPEMKLGALRIVHDSPDLLTRARAARDGQPLNAEKYTRLFVDGTLWMTDAEFECWTNRDFCREAYGDVLIAGLGLGLILPPLLQNDEVSSVTVLEISPDVIAAIEPIYRHKKLTVILADVNTFSPLKRAFDCVYFDIWADVPNSDQKPQIQALKKRYRTSLKSGGRTAAWCERNAYRRDQW